MAKPWRRPETGIYYLRVKVPADVARHVGRKIEKISLKTSDPVLARQRFAVKLAELRKRWNNLKRYHDLTLLEAHALAHEIYLLKRAHFHSGKFRPFLEVHAGWVLASFAGAHRSDTPESHERFSRSYGKHIQAFLDKRGMRLEPANRKMLDLAVAKALLQAQREDFKNLGGDFSDDPDIGRFPPVGAVDSSTPLSIVDTYEEFAQARKLAPSTVKRWRGAIRSFAEFLGHDDFRRLTRSDYIGWTEVRLTINHPVTVRDVHLAAMKSLSKWLISKDRLQVNLAAGISIDVPQRVQLRNSEFTDEEAVTILEAALRPHPGASETMAGAYRWVPWICAYTGARVNEITQLRVEDIQTLRGYTVFHITPDAGTTKNQKRRYVPVHEHLIEQGLLRFVAAKGDGPLFYDLPKRGNGSKTDAPYHKTGQKIARWVRSLGITDAEVMPNHAWRHLFKMLGRDVEMSDRVLDVIQGHAPRTDGERYGSWGPRRLDKEMSKFPRFEVDPYLEWPDEGRPDP